MENCNHCLIERPPEKPGGISLLDAESPQAVVDCGVSIANQLARIIKRQKLSVTIQGKRHVLSEGWSLIGAMCGVLPREVSVTEDAAGNVIAVVELIRISDQAILGRASAMCGIDEKEWAKRPRHARRSMALTRAVGKAFRLCFSWVIKLAGYESCPAEEIIDIPHAELLPVVELPVSSDTPSAATTGAVIGMADVGVHSEDTSWPSRPDQHAQIKAMVQRLHISVVAAKKLVAKHGGKRLADLTIAGANAAIRDLEAYEADSDCPF